jgi:hypothetical protein
MGWPRDATRELSGVSDDSDPRMLSPGQITLFSVELAASLVIRSALVFGPAWPTLKSFNNCAGDTEKGKKKDKSTIRYKLAPS